MFDIEGFIDRVVDGFLSVGESLSTLEFEEVITECCKQTNLTRKELLELLERMK